MPGLGILTEKTASPASSVPLVLTTEEEMNLPPEAFVSEETNIGLVKTADSASRYTGHPRARQVMGVVGLGVGVGGGGIGVGVGGIGVGVGVGAGGGGGGGGATYEERKSSALQPSTPES